MTLPCLTAIAAAGLLALPGESDLRVVSPTLLEVRLVTRESPLPRAPSPGSVRVSANGREVPVARTGLRRRVSLAPLRVRDLRVGTSLLIELGSPLRDGDAVRVVSPALEGVSAAAWEVRVDPLRLGPALHASLVGYLPSLPKSALVGFYAGTLGEMKAPADRTFAIERAGSGEVVRHGQLVPRPDEGMPGDPPAYQQVLEADFSSLRAPGVYRLSVPGLGRSSPFRIGDEVAALMARTYALGLYHQRCGDALSLPFTRFVHGACHRAPALAPAAAWPGLDAQLEGFSKNAPADARRMVPSLRRLADSLFPAVATGPRDLTGGHHDAGDYGKYTIDSALFVHHLVFAADAFPGVASLDNLGLPESGDGVGDVLQAARRETDFLAKMQDEDGGFFFLVRPRDRAYEDDVLPDRGDPQGVFPKNTSGTAAAVAALAQAGSSPSFRAAFPDASARALAAARRGWAFLLAAWARRGRTGAYQRVTHYGDVFEDRDEVAWAATEVFLATGDAPAHALLLRELDPSRPEARRWTWWRLFEGYGAAVRSYAFASRTGRDRGRALDPTHLARCRQEVLQAGRDQAGASRASAYGTSYPPQGKRGLRAGWYFGENAVFDLVAARQLSDEAGFASAIAGNLAYATGANPVGLAYVTGLAVPSPQEVVHSYAVNDRRAFPPGGLLLGQIRQGLPWLRPYGAVLRGLSLPPDDGPSPYPIYDRFSDTFDVTSEATIVDQARALAGAAALLAATPLARQPWRPPSARIVGLAGDAPFGQRLELSLEVPGLDVASAQVSWEAEGREPTVGPRLVLEPRATTWVEAEALWPDGRRVAAETTIVVR